MDFETVLTYFDVTKRGRDKAQARCPCHDDRQASLTISRGEKQPVVFHCHAGCRVEDILAARGLTMKDIMDETETPPEKPVEAWKTFIEGREGRQIGGTYHYRDSSGRYCFSKIRLNPNTPEEQKTFRIGTFSEGFSGGRFSYGLGGKEKEDFSAFFCPDFGAFRDAVARKETIFYTEGEKDAVTLYSRGFQAITCGAAGDWIPAVAEVFRGAVVVILADADEPGQKSARAVKKDLDKVARWTHIVTPMPEPEHADVSDYFKDHTAQDFRQLLLRYFHTWSAKNGLEGVYDFRVFEFLKAREDILILGGTPYVYQGGVFRADSNGAILKSMIRDLIYPSKVKSTTLKRIYDLFISAAELQATAEDFNRFPETWVPFRNGFYDPVTEKMIPHDPKYRALNQIPHDYFSGKKETGKTVKAWLDFITEGKPDSLEMLLQYCGYCMTMDTRQQKFLILHGLGGTGKSLLIRLIEEALGAENISHISLADLTQRFAPYGLLGKLLNSCADLEITALEDVSLLKKILGEDGIRAESKGRTRFLFGHEQS